MSRFANVMVVLGFAYALRTALSLFVIGLDNETGWAEYFNSVLFMAALGVLTAKTVGIKKAELLGKGEPPFSTTFSMAVILALTLVMFDMGAYGLQTFLLSLESPALGQSSWLFWLQAPSGNGYEPSFNWPTLATLLLTLVIGPIAEEIAFRVALLSPYLDSEKFLYHALLGSALFGVIHFRHFGILPAFVFSLAVSYQYRSTRSLWPCVITHGAVNLFHFLLKYQFSDWLMRDLTAATEIATWSAELVMLAGSVLLLSGFALYASRTHSYSYSKKSDRSIKTSKI